ncbi:broad-complex core protein isoforms 1/2/3/4/5-like [Anopheles nili]|uniref:broad-complex core protein isoforms 1/2/3/4/5-like n=1 Tax=Anopheles nili TaxID=185578 RepID=UPI00237AF012|nr:broad-complex core protein isoforms 1/2/3/4/5-like [Anopheles nili]
MDLQQYCLRWTHHHTNLQVMFYQLLERGYFCDVTLACEGQTIRAHRVVLCACSTYFANLLTNVNIEKDPIIIMREEKFKEVKCLIEFMYKGEIYVEQSAIAALLQTAASLGIKGLTEVSRQNDYYRANNLNQDTIKSHDSCLSGGNDPDMHVTEHDSNVYAYETDNDDISSHNTTENYDTNKPDRNTNSNCNEYNEHSLPSPRELISPSDCKQWKDVVKMNEYLVHGKRPQFWEESFTKRILHGIKNKEIEMKHAAKILGVSYGTLYGRYRETYGSLKHAYRYLFLAIRVI